jgi:Na+/H+-dicarboxylate symporter
VCFLSTVVISAVLMMVGVLFSYSSGYYYFYYSIRKHEAASQGLKSQSCSLPMTFTNYCREKMLALIIFSFLIGFACLRSGEKGAL